MVVEREKPLPALHKSPLHEHTHTENVPLGLILILGFVQCVFGYLFPQLLLTARKRKMDSEHLYI